MYTPLRIYETLGKFDKAVNISFRRGSATHEAFGDDINVVFMYTQVEREGMDALLANGEAGEPTGYIKARYLGFDLPDDKVRLLTSPGILSSDITSILSATWSPEKNTFHSTDTRQLNKIEVPFRRLPKGGDYNWMYGFDKERVAEGIGLSPYERSVYLGRKLYFEPDSLTAEEHVEMLDDNGIVEDVEREYLAVLYKREEANEEQKKNLLALLKKHRADRFKALDDELKKIGSSIKKLIKVDEDKAGELLLSVVQFSERRLNITGKYPIYLDLKGFLHIWMRHVEDMKINQQFANKDNYQWEEPDVIRVMGHIVEQINEEVQAYFDATPNTRFSKYGRESVYYEGDYYTLHIEPSGRIDTMHKNRKTHEQKPS
ncbi:hypothetical protein F0P96_18595 [Hymenobacter busanensis]|uniref:Uncharacterized protein n=1 Tax=Hymenobacter busanensis TaxID=2607656 RepID=A0A7L4ZRU4_9BACT|nr:hypothetical protein [Hymenobacter busanensis]KAA9327243.1 hypothetical protein F0P96_18595 [Hymenobacter busanensis]QHJ05909.1 hypothetical protein GUY19_00800 [Hymenobacter busanensis]